MINEAKFSEEKVFSQFKRIKNRLRKYIPEEIILNCISHLTLPNPDPRELKQYPPWLLLLLLKWTLLFGELLSIGRRHVGKADFEYLVNLMHELSSFMRLPSEYESVFLFFRNLAFQQFWLQEELRPTRIARQSMLFGHLEDNHSFRRDFASRVGVDIEDFIELSIALLMNPGPDLSEGWFQPIQKSYHEGTIQRFLYAIARDFESSRRYLLAEVEKNRNVSYEFYEQSPLKRYPLLKLSEKYYAYSTSLLAYSLESFISDELRVADPNGFTTKFGMIFQRYVTNCLEQSGLPFLDERAIKEFCGSDKKTVDYLMVDKDVNIFVDAKGVEMGNLGMVTHLADVVRGKTESSLVKGIDQGLETASCVAGKEKIENLVLGHINYLVLVTYKDLYIGNGVFFHDFIARETVERIVANHGGQQWIPFSHMFFMSIDDFEHLIECTKQSGIRLAEQLSRAVQSDSDPNTQKFIFRQHTYENCSEVAYPGYLMEEFEFLKKRLKDRVLQ